MEIILYLCPVGLASAHPETSVSVVPDLIGDPELRSKNLRSHSAIEKIPLIAVFLNSSTLTLTFGTA
jgi:hypothetical protein